MNLPVLLLKPKKKNEKNILEIVNQTLSKFEQMVSMGA